eukprot:jgi/Mesvir1/25927/Mv25943-RA.2
MLLPSLARANEAGIPIYFVGGADPESYQGIQRREPATGPVHASIRYIGADMAHVAESLASRLMSLGITHLECIATDAADLMWYRQCGRLVDIYEQAGLSARRQLRAPVLLFLSEYVAGMTAEFALVPAREIAVVVPDWAAYRAVRRGLLESTKADALMVTYETSVDVLEDVRSGRNVLALDFNYYTQGFLGLVLASAERQTGQMVTSDIMTEWKVYGQGAREVTDEVMQREICRAARNPVCGDPGVAPVTPTGCPCFNRSEVAYKVVTVTPSYVGPAANMWQGMVDAERDLPGSTFRWDIQPDCDYEFLLADVTEVAKDNSRWRGAISLDTMLLDNPRVASALRFVQQSGKPLLFGNMQSQGPSGIAPGTLAPLGAHVFVGANLWSAGYMASRYAVQLGYEHLLGVNTLQYFAWPWMILQGVAAGVLGTGYVYPEGTWDWPLGGNASERTGAWSLFVAPGSNHTTQAMNGAFPMPDYLADLKQQLISITPAPDLVVTQALFPSSTAEILAALRAVGAAQPGRPPIGLILQECTMQAFQALSHQGFVPGEERLMGCVDYQLYLSTYLLATLAALEQQTGERVVGNVQTERLIRVTHLPPTFQTRVACETLAYNQGTSKGIFGQMYPVCDVRKGCVDPDPGPTPGDTSSLMSTSLSQQVAAASDLVCSGHGTCQFLTSAPAVDRNNPNLTYRSMEGVCECRRGWSGDFCSVAIAVTDDSMNDRRLHVLLISLVVTAVFILLAVTVPIAFWSRWKRGRQLAVVEEFLRKRAPPRKGDWVTCVITDIEGSTSLWEWNPTVMRQALAIHHNVLRALLPKYYGYESDTEGDSFFLVFHNPTDALGWAMDVQRTLLFPATLFKESDWPAELLSFGAGKEERSVDGTFLYRGLRVRMGIHIGMPESCTMHANGRQHYQGEVVEVTKAIQDAAASGGQVLVSMPAWQSLGMHSVAVVCHDLGLQEVGEKLPPVHLLEVLPTALVKRAPFLTLKSRKLSPSFFDAPGTLAYVRGQPPKESLVIAFLYVGRAKLLRKVPYYKEAVQILTGFVQQLLTRFDGYECEEKEGNFLLAFRSGDQAARFAATVQRDAMSLMWPPQILEQEGAAEVLKSPEEGSGLPHNGDIVVFRGLRLQIGLCLGVPSDVQPHRTTGRAAYFGPIVNRAARIAATAACGQTLANHLLFESIKESCPDLCFKELGQFDLKGVKEPMHLYQVSPPELNGRLFPRTLRLASITDPIYPNPAASGTILYNEGRRSSEDSEGRQLSISIHSDFSVRMHSHDATPAKVALSTQVDHFLHTGPAIVEPPLNPIRISKLSSCLADCSQVACDSETEGESPEVLPPKRNDHGLGIRKGGQQLPGLEEQIRAEYQYYSHEELLQLIVKMRVDSQGTKLLPSMGRALRRSMDGIISKASV